MTSLHETTYRTNALYRRLCDEGIGDNLRALNERIEAMVGKKNHTQTLTIPLNRGNLERAAQLARRAVAELDGAIAIWADEAMNDSQADEANRRKATSIATLSDALTELGE